MDLEKEIEYFIKIVPVEVTHTRFDHSLRVAELAEKFARINLHPIPRKAYLAGILHDITKQKTKDFHKDIFSKNNFDFSDLPEPAFHPFSAVFYLKEKYKFVDPEILSAIQNHTLGNTDMPLLDKILYLSDFLGSDYAIKQKEYSDWVKLSESDLSYGILLKSKTVIADLLEKNQKIHPLTIKTYNYYLPS